MGVYDAVLIPGGGVRPGGVLPPWIAARFDRALERAGDAWFMVLSAGTPHRPPPLDARGFPISEARAGADYLISRGVAPHRILIEASSYDTIGNAYFSRMIHVAPRGFERLLIVTSEFHMPRTEAAFRWVYGLDGPGQTSDLAFDSVPDRDVDPLALQARRAKEADSLKLLDTLWPRIATLAELHQWLFTQHGVYRAMPESRPPMTDSRLETY